jgi:hypothetical protein
MPHSGEHYCHRRGNPTAKRNRDFQRWHHARRHHQRSLELDGSDRRDYCERTVHAGLATTFASGTTTVGVNRGGTTATTNLSAN